MNRWVLGLWCWLFVLAAYAQPASRALPPLRTLIDEAGVLSVDEGLALSRSLEEVLRRTGVRAVMVITRTTAPEAIEDYAERLAQQWRRERSIDPDRCVFIVVALGDRELQVSPGRALAELERALQRAADLDELPPLLRGGRYFEALTLLTNRIRQIIEAHPPRPYGT